MFQGESNILQKENNISHFITYSDYNLQLYNDNIVIRRHHFNSVNLLNEQSKELKRYYRIIFSIRKCSNLSLM